MPHWEDVNARARGLGTRLLGPDALHALAQHDGPQALARALAAQGLLPEDTVVATVSDLSLALRRAAAREVGVLRRWLGSRDAVLAVALDGEDRRSLRALIRGAAEGAPAQARLAGLIPTPGLPERLLEELAGRTSIRDLATLLVAAGHPYGAPVLAAAADGEPDLFRIELAIAHAFADRARRGARRAGPFLREYVTFAIDRDNLRTALVFAGSDSDEPAAGAFIPGGRLTAAEFERAAAAGSPAEAADALARTGAGRDIAPLLFRDAARAAALEGALEERALAAVRREARLDPLGPAPVLLYLHDLRRQSAALGRLLWSMDLGVPPSLRLPAPSETR
jgi:vacuolar-type H+-ATPase subunit C/Vma6